MKKIIKLISLISIIVIVFSYTVINAATREINVVSVTDIEVPYTVSNVLDTSAKIPKDAPYRVSEISWKNLSTSQNSVYEVTVELTASKSFTFSKETTGTINEKNISKMVWVDDDVIEISYIFEEKSNTSVGSDHVTLRHRIDTYYDEEMGKISPYSIRPLHGSNQIVTITPNEGYKIKDVKVDGDSVGAVTEYRFRNVKENHTIRATFEKIESAKEEIKETEEKEEIVSYKPIYEIIKAIINLIKM